MRLPALTVVLYGSMLAFAGSAAGAQETKAPETQLPAAPEPAPAVPPPLADAPSAVQPPAPSRPAAVAPPLGVPGFSAYESCSFAGGLAITERTELNGGVKLRDAETSHGAVVVQLEAGERMLLGYPRQDAVAEVRFEKLPPENFGAQKRTLIEEFDHTLAQSPEGVRNYGLPARMRGFQIYGLDREKLGGSVLGVYLFFDDLNRIATTIHFMNQDTATRPFQTIEEYRKLRDQLLNAYTGCIRKNQGVAETP